MKKSIVLILPALALIGVLAAIVAAGCSDSSGVRGTTSSVNNTSGTSGQPGCGAFTREQVLRGRYLVTAVASCMDCHSPGKSPADAGWLGGFVPGAPGVPFLIGPQQLIVYPANLTPDSTGLRSWTPQQIFTALRTGKDNTGRFLCPPMPWTNFRNMTDDDTWSLVAYLRSLKPYQNTVPVSQGPATLPNGDPDWSSYYQGLPPLPAYPAASENAVP